MSSEIVGEVRGASVYGGVSSDDILGGVEIGGIIINNTDLPYYEGSYDVIPEIEAFILPVKNQAMRNDLIIHEIPYYETSNDKGGYTAIIGG